MRLEIKVLSVRRDFWKVQGIARVGDDIACSAELMSIGKDMAS